MNARAALTLLACSAVAAFALVLCSSTTPLLQCCEDRPYRAPEHKILTTYSILYLLSRYSNCQQTGRPEGQVSEVYI